MISLKSCKSYYHFPFPSNSTPKLQEEAVRVKQGANLVPKRIVGRRKLVARGSGGQESEGKKTERRSFLSPEEAGLVEISGLSTHERFLCRLTISSLNLLRVISEQEGCAIEELNAGRVCDWFLKDKLKREQDIGSAVLQWDDSDFPT